MSDEVALPAPKFPPLLYTQDGKPLFEPINQAQYDYITATEPNLWFYGNRGGGKSVTARNTCHTRALACPGYRYAIMRTSFPELIKNHLIYLSAEMEQLGGSYIGNKFIAKYPNGSLGFYMQAETDEQVRNALGVEMHELVLDEAPTFRWEHITMLASSIRVPPGLGYTPLLRLLGNPIGPCIDDIFKYYVYKDVDLNEEPDYNPADYRSIYIDLKDNTKLDVEAYRKKLGVGLPEHIRKAWLDGEKMDYGQLFEVIKNKDGKPYHVIPEMLTVNGKALLRYEDN